MDSVAAATLSRRLSSRRYATGLIQINERRSCVPRVPAMGWTSISLLALVAGTVAAVVLLVFGALTWFLNHPVD